MKDTFTGGFVEWWKRTIPDSLRAQVGPIFQDEVPETFEGRKVTFPYTVFFADNTNTDYTTNQIYFETWKLSVHIYCAGSDAADKAGKEVTSFLTNPLFGYSGGAVMRSIPDVYQLDSMAVRTSSGITVYRARCGTEMLVRTSR